MAGGDEGVGSKSRAALAFNSLVNLKVSISLTDDSGKKPRWRKYGLPLRTLRREQHNVLGKEVLWGFSPV
jgi:hypothetical protein